MTMTRIVMGEVAASFRQTGSSMRIFLGFALLLSLFASMGCRLGTSSTAEDAETAGVHKKTPNRTPIDPAVLRADAERQAEWTPLRKAKCPRQLPDRHEELRRYPAISILEGLGYITISDGTAHGMYVKNMQMTFEGRRQLG